MVTLSGRALVGIPNRPKTLKKTVPGSSLTVPWVWEPFRGPPKTSSRRPRQKQRPSRSTPIPLSRPSRLFSHKKPTPSVPLPKTGGGCILISPLPSQGRGWGLGRDAGISVRPYVDTSGKVLNVRRPTCRYVRESSKRSTPHVSIRPVTVKTLHRSFLFYPVKAESPWRHLADTSREADFVSPGCGNVVECETGKKNEISTSNNT
jgi:hypothetical protein